MSGKRKTEQSRSVGKTLDEALGVPAPSTQQQPPQADGVVRALMGALVTATRATNALPGAEGGGTERCARTPYRRSNRLSLMYM
jgi:hypothetical protein